MPCATIEGTFYYNAEPTDDNIDNVVNVCGGEDNMFTPAELGCTTIGQPCSHAPLTGKYWLNGNSNGVFKSHQPGVVNGVLQYGDAATDLMSEPHSALCK